MQGAIIEIRPGAPVERSFDYTDKSGNKQNAKVLEQPALLYRPGDAVPDKFMLPVRKNESPYPPGRYTIDASELRIRFNKLELQSRYGLKLIPVAAAADARNTKSA